MLLYFQLLGALVLLQPSLSPINFLLSPKRSPIAGLFSVLVSTNLEVVSRIAFTPALTPSCVKAILSNSIKAASSDIKASIAAFLSSIVCIFFLYKGYGCTSVSLVSGTELTELSCSSLSYLPTYKISLVLSSFVPKVH